MTAPGDVIDWLLDSDPSIRWQVMRDLLGARESDWAAERAKIESMGWGAKLLALQDEDGQWAGGSFVPRGFHPPRLEEVRPAMDGHDFFALAASRVRLRSLVGPGETDRQVGRPELALG